MSLPKNFFDSDKFELLAKNMLKKGVKLRRNGDSVNFIVNDVTEKYEATQHALVALMDLKQKCEADLQAQEAPANDESPEEPEENTESSEDSLANESDSPDDEIIE